MNGGLFGVARRACHHPPRKLPPTTPSQQFADRPTLMLSWTPSTRETERMSAPSKKENVLTSEKGDRHLSRRVAAVVKQTVKKHQVVPKAKPRDWPAYRRGRDQRRMHYGFNLRAGDAAYNRGVAHGKLIKEEEVQWERKRRIYLEGKLANLREAWLSCTRPQSAERTLRCLDLSP